MEIELKKKFSKRKHAEIGLIFYQMTEFPIHTCNDQRLFLNRDENPEPDAITALLFLKDGVPLEYYMSSPGSLVFCPSS